MSARRCLPVSVWSFVISVLVGFGVLPVADAIGDIRRTPHNLIKSRDGSVSDKHVCVFCHTPLNDQGDPAQGRTGTGAPRWQKALADGFVFAIYDDIGRLGLGSRSVGSQSMACLSCHDSNQAIGLGKVSTDHPYGVPYRGVINPSPSAIVTPVDDSLAPFRNAKHALELENFREANQATIENRSIFWVSRNGVTAFRARDDLPLYARNYESELLGPGIMVPHVECSSCHDPHSESKTFLRGSQAGSELCLTCHDK